MNATDALRATNEIFGELARAGKIPGILDEPDHKIAGKKQAEIAVEMHKALFDYFLSLKNS